MRYIWLEKKRLSPKFRVHFEGADGMTVCKAENNSARTKEKFRLAPRSETPPPGKLCGICTHLTSVRTPRTKPLPPKQNDSDFYRSWEWMKLRYEVLKTYGAICMCCRSTENIVVDHIKSRRLRPDLELDFDNLQVLCRSCNRGKSWDDATDFRPKTPEPQITEEQMEHLRTIRDS